MKNFLYHLLILHLLIISVFVLKKQYLDHSDFFYYKGKKINFGDIEILILGHSQSECGIDEDLIQNSLNLNTFNFSQSGRPLFYSIKLLEFIRKKNKDIVPIIGLGTNNFGKRGSVKELFSDLNLRNAKYLSENIFFLDYSDLIFFAKEDFVSFYTSVFRSLIEMPLTFNGSVGHISYFPNIWDKLDLIENQVKEDYKIRPSLINFELNYIVSFLGRFSSKIYFVKLPELRPFPFFFDNKKIIENFVNQITTKLNSCYIDYTDLFCAEENFRDFNHLSQNGKYHLTKELINRINNEK